MFTSCSSDDNDSSSSVILPKTVKHTFTSYPEDNYTSTIVYNGNKIVSITDDDGSRQDFTYDGDVITKIIGYDIENGKDLKDNEVSYTYENGKLVTSSYAEVFSSEYPTGRYKGRNVYTHNSDGTVVKIESYSINTSTGVETKNNYSLVNTFENGNLVKITSTYQTDVFEYDSKNNPTKNILGLNLLLDEGYSVNNIIKHTSSQSTTVYKTEYVYDENGYPTKEIEYNNTGNVDQVTEFTY